MKIVDQPHPLTVAIPDAILAGRSIVGAFIASIVGAIIAPRTSAIVAIFAAALLTFATPVVQAQVQAPAPAPGSPEAAQAAELDTLMKTERFRHLASELRCLVCQNQTLEDSHAPLAKDLRDEVARLMAGGRDDQQIKSHLVDRYGEFVLFRPAVSSRNAVLWFGPFLLLLGGAIAWWGLGRSKPQSRQSAQEALKHVDELLERENHG